MRQSATWKTAWVLGAVVALTTGCADSKDRQIEALQEQYQAAMRDKDQCEREKADLEARLGQAQNEATLAARRALELQGRIQDLERQLAAANAAGARDTGPGITRRGDFTESGDFAWVDIGDDILFDSGKAELKSGGKSRIREIVQQIQINYPGRDIWVIGHTDSDPIVKTKNIWKDNLDLSMNRARTVALEMMNLGLPKASVIAGGQGENNPKAPNATTAGKAQNRRVQIVAVSRPPTVSTGS